MKEIDERARRIQENSSSSSSAVPLDDSNSGSSSNPIAKDLMQAVSALPELTEKKRVLAAHGNAMRAVFQEIQKREIPKLHEIEVGEWIGQE